MFDLHGVLRTHTQATDYLKQTSSICGSYVWYKCKIIPQLQQMLVFSIFHTHMQQSNPILYPSNVQNAGELNILFHKFSLNPPYFFVLLYWF